MSKIRNIVYGLALGDAIGFRIENKDYETIVSRFADEDLYSIPYKLWVSDDTTMSVYLMRTIQRVYNPSQSLSEQLDVLTDAIAKDFVAWYGDPDCMLGRGRATRLSLNALQTHLESNSEIFDPFYGSDDKSKGSGTVMRTPWLGILNGQGILGDKDLQLLCESQSQITHRNLTAVHASYVTARIVGALYAYEIKAGEILDFAMELCRQQVEDDGWREIMDSFTWVQNLPKGYLSLDATEFDPSSVLGYGGTAHEVLVHAIAIVDAFGYDPTEVLRRCMFTGGDSDTIGAIAGAMVGATVEDDVWDGLYGLLDDYTTDDLDAVVGYLNGGKYIRVGGELPSVSLLDTNGRWVFFKI